MNMYPMNSDEMQERITKLEDDLAEIKDMLMFIRDTMVNADSTITKVAGEVMPSVQQLMKSPMLKMLGVKL